MSTTAERTWRRLMSPVDPAAGTAAGTAREQAAEHIDVTRNRVARRSRVREVIFGTQDGLLATLGLVVFFGGAFSDRYTVLIAGLAGAVAGLIAMGAGAYISSKSQLEVAVAEVARENRELAANPERELEELVQLYEAEGLPEVDARLVAEKIAQRPLAMLNAMTQKELRLAIEANEPVKEGIVMALAFLVGAVVPIAPWGFAAISGGPVVAGLPFPPSPLASGGLSLRNPFGAATGTDPGAHPFER